MTIVDNSEKRTEREVHGVCVTPGICVNANFLSYLFLILISESGCDTRKYKETRQGRQNQLELKD